MLLMFVLIAIFAFLEVGFFFHLRQQARALAGRQIAAYAVQASSEAAMKEAEATLLSARDVYNRAVADAAQLAEPGRGTHDASVKRA